MDNKLALLKKGSQCITPFTVRMKLTNESIPVPCGKCPQCIARRTSAWSFRLLQEEKNAISAHFLTLTYDTDHVPITRNGYMTLDKTDVQKFLKRLRKVEAPMYEKDDDGNFINSLKYYLCGEYGGNTNRPHYHVIIFNVRLLSSIEKSWQLGSVHYGAVSGASVGYTLKYISKAKKIPYHRNDDRLQEFSLMSKGLGLAYMTEEMINYHNEDIYGRNCCNLEEGKKIAMPRYYRERIFTESQRAQQKAWMKQQEPIKREDIKSKYPGNYIEDKVQSDLHRFDKLKKSSEKRDKL